MVTKNIRRIATYVTGRTSLTVEAECWTDGSFGLKIRMNGFRLSIEKPISLDPQRGALFRPNSSTCHFLLFTEPGALRFEYGDQNDPNPRFYCHIRFDRTLLLSERAFVRQINDSGNEVPFGAQKAREVSSRISETILGNPDLLATIDCFKSKDGDLIMKRLRAFLGNVTYGEPARSYRRESQEWTLTVGKRKLLRRSQVLLDGMVDRARSSR